MSQRLLVTVAVVVALAALTVMTRRGSSFVATALVVRVSAQAYHAVQVERVAAHSSRCAMRLRFLGRASCLFVWELSQRTLGADSSLLVCRTWLLTR